MLNTIMSKFLGRNYHLAVLVTVLSFILCLYGHMTGGEWTTLAGGIFAAFRAGDALVNWIHRANIDEDLDESHLPPSTRQEKHSGEKTDHE
jgi:hypothetical protein